ncbi:hypothetical protein [uncultured Desulfosarcina sp.]|nr:hypothetical protein [uncultured Desulfosarcina sp.]
MSLSSSAATPTFTLAGSTTAATATPPSLGLGRLATLAAGALSSA